LDILDEISWLISLPFLAQYDFFGHFGLLHRVSFGGNPDDGFSVRNLPIEYVLDILVREAKGPLLPFSIFTWLRVKVLTVELVESIASEEGQLSYIGPFHIEFFLEGKTDLA
jgi:hypothetical protein